MDADLRREGFLGRFLPDTEVEYRHWMVVQLRPLATQLGLLSIAIWVIAPFLYRYGGGALVHPNLLYLFAWGVNIPVLVAALLYSWRTAARHQILVLNLALTIIGVDSLVVVGFVLPETRAGTYAFGIAFFTMLAPLMRIPVLSTIVTMVIITATGFALVGTRAPDGWSELLVGPNATLPLITFVLVPGLAVVNERSLRASFVDERVIARQQAQLEESRKLIRRYAPSSVVSHIEEGDHTVDQPQRRKVTVFFSDVVGFTALADRVDPEALAEIVNDYLGALSEVIERHGGTLNEFAGDGVMALFGAPDELDAKDQVLAAIATAQELQRSLPEWSRTWYQHGIVEDPQARVGINTGTISVGTFGSAVRATYTGIGLQTNIAARVQAEAKPGGILLSNTSWHLIKDEVACEPRGEVMVKGVHFPIELYEPVG